MQLMVYAPYGRAGIYMLQEFCRRVGIRATKTGIRDLIRALCALPAGHPLQAILTQAPEPRSEAALADALRSGVLRTSFSILLKMQDWSSAGG